MRNNDCFSSSCACPPRECRWPCWDREPCPAPVRRCTVTFRKVDSLTLMPLCGALFELTRGNCLIGMATSDRCGNVSFHHLAPGQYCLKEIRPPCGYRTNPFAYTLIVCEDGTATIDGLSSTCFSVGNVRL